MGEVLMLPQAIHWIPLLIFDICRLDGGDIYFNVL